jgi:Icc-related predicted phosphoesterase
MKIALASDLHLEFGPLTVVNSEQADVLVLAGDILIAADLYRYKKHRDVLSDGSALVVAYNRYVDFFASATTQFKKIIWVPGNHEHYHGNLIHTRPFCEQFLKDEAFANVVFMDQDVLTIEDTTFFGATLWTNLNKRDPIAMMVAQDYMNDYKEIGNGPRPMIPRDTVEAHEATLKRIQETLEKSEKLVVVGHHSPSTLSTHLRFQKPQHEYTNWSYHSDLSEFILDNPKIKLWIHGHVHDDFDYMIGSTRITCNPRGYYGFEARADEFQLKYIEV